MKLCQLFESHNLVPVLELVIRSWGKILYLDYRSLPTGQNMADSEEIIDLADEYLEAVRNKDSDKLEELDEWINEGAPLKNGKLIFNRTTIDSLFKELERPVGKELKLYRFDHTPNKLQPNSWISLTTRESGYQGERSEYTLEASDKAIDCRDLADPGEYIINTNILLAK